jgi:hypothetical protein
MAGAEFELRRCPIAIGLSASRASPVAPVRVNAPPGSPYFHPRTKRPGNAQKAHLRIPLGSRTEGHRIFLDFWSIQKTQYLPSHVPRAFLTVED